MRDSADTKEIESDQLTYAWAAWTLRAGMYASFGAMSLGLLLWLISGAPGGESSASEVIPFDRLWAELAALNPLALLNVGVLLLLATPGVTLLSAVVTYGIERNWRYMSIALLVGLILVASLVISTGLIKLF